MFHRTIFYRILFPAFIALVMFSGCGKKQIDIEAHKKEIQEWQQKRITRLTRNDGWLTLCGLFWLKEGENTFGGDSSNVVIFPPAKAPKIAGSLLLDHGIVQLHAKPGADVRWNDSLITTIEMKSDADTAGPTIIHIGTVSFYVIKRGDQVGVRMKDKENYARTHFKGLEYFPIDPKWRIEAKFEPYIPPKMIPIATMINTVDTNQCPGALVFDVDGKQCRLDVVVEQGSEDQFFIMFADETSGKETYGNGRQLYTSLPDSNKTVVLDFNKAYNWPCVFTVFATCPIPPRQNHLPFRVEAGEKMYTGH